jgi:hypothetical protein
LSVSERLKALAFGSVGVTTTSSLATTVPLIITGATAGTIAYVAGQEPPQQSTSSVGGIPAASQQTFSPSSPTFQGTNTAFTPQQTAFQRTLEVLKSTLLLLLEYLKPFNNRTYLVEHESEYDY